MILDSSAIVAILQGEPEAEEFATLIENAGEVWLSAATLLEASIVLGPRRRVILDSFLAEARVKVVPFDDAQADVARDAATRFGRGSGSPAKLNFGDCFSYALTSVSGRPLLFKGDDFGETDISSPR